MQYVTVTYPNREGARFDFDYYMKKHIPMVSSLLGRKIEVCKGVASATGGPIAFVCAARICVDSIEEFQATMTKHGAQIMGDIPKYTDIQPIVQVDEVVE